MTSTKELSVNEFLSLGEESYWREVLIFVVIILLSLSYCTLSTGSYSFINLVFVVIMLLYFRLGFISSWKRLEVTRVRKQRLVVTAIWIMINKK